jgi:hypothetical protein
LSQLIISSSGVLIIESLEDTRFVLASSREVGSLAPAGHEIDCPLSSSARNNAFKILSPRATCSLETRMWDVTPFLGTSNFFSFSFPRASNFYVLKTEAWESSCGIAIFGATSAANAARPELNRSRTQMTTISRPFSLGDNAGCRTLCPVSFFRQ